MVVAGICRWLHRRGVRVAPFKAQNMSLNSFATRDGRELGRAQAMQAQAAGIEPMVEIPPEDWHLLPAVPPGKDSVNLDLIAELPNQTVESFAKTLDEAIELGVGHISLYMLDLEERSPLKVQVDRGRVVIPDDEAVATMYTEAIARLASAGLHQYEISNFAREGEECRHNLRYWTRGEYRGFGLGAHSLMGDRRFANTRDIRKYIEQSPDAVDFVEELGDVEVQRETIFLRLRQTSGIDYAELEQLRGQEATEWINRGLRDGWLEQHGARVAFTPSGFLLSNEFISQLF